MELPIAAQMQAGFIKISAGARLQLVDAPEDSVARRSAGPKKQQVIEPTGIHLRGDLREAQETFKLGGKEEASAPAGIEPGLDAHGIPGQKQPAAAWIIDGEGKNAIELLGAGIAPAEIGPEQHLSIRCGIKAVPKALQFIAQLWGVV